MRGNRNLLVVGVALLIGLWFWTQSPRQGDAPPLPTVYGSGSPSTDTGVPSERQASAEGHVARGDARGLGRTTTDYPAFLPREAHAVLDAIARGGPYAHRQDGAVFQNREGRLPRQARSYYREFTVDTPGSRDRGARRIVTGGDPPVDYFYTDDHYRSFRRFEPSRAQVRQ